MEIESVIPFQRFVAELVKKYRRGELSCKECHAKSLWENHETRLLDVELKIAHRIWIDRTQQRIIRRAVANKVNIVCQGSSFSRQKCYRMVYDDLRKYFEFDSYQEIPECSFEEAVQFVENWELVKVVK